MFGKILYIGESKVFIENKIAEDAATDLMNLHIIFEFEDQRVLGEVYEIDDKLIKARMLGEFINDNYMNGVLKNPNLNSSIRVINGDELAILVGKDDGSSLILGKHATYRSFQICSKLNSLLANHLSIFGNSGSGKSYGVSRIVQNLFNNSNLNCTGANIFIFDSFGEYKTAFAKLGDSNPAYGYKFITTKKELDTDIDLKIPLNLLTSDDWTLLLNAESHSQITIIEHTIKLAKIIAQNNLQAQNYKNHIIAKALLAVLFSSQTTEVKKNEIFKIIEVCATKELDFNTVIPGQGYTRTFSECFEIDSRGFFGESVLITDYIMQFVNDDIENETFPDDASFTLIDFQNALEFTLISGGFLHNETLYDSAVILKVRLNYLARGNLARIFSSEVKTLPEYINSLIYTDKKNQIININLEEIDDTTAKVIVKIISRFLFDFGKTTENRAKTPFHIFLEEAHRYVQKDNDVFLLGYNIFERIAKEGRKYGVLLNIISQRPVEISDTVISQVSNFLIFKMTHPLDLKYIEEMLPNMSSEVVAKLKTLQPGTCCAFGSAFKIPMIISLEMPNPEPFSSSCNVTEVWKNIAPIAALPVSKKNNNEEKTFVLNEEKKEVSPFDIEFGINTSAENQSVQSNNPNNINGNYNQPFSFEPQNNTLNQGFHEQTNVVNGNSVSETQNLNQSPVQQDFPGQKFSFMNSDNQS